MLYGLTVSTVLLNNRKGLTVLSDAVFESVQMIRCLEAPFPLASEQQGLSLFEPHTRAIPRHKGGGLVEFGRHVILDEVERQTLERSRIWRRSYRRRAGIEGRIASLRRDFRLAHKRLSRARRDGALAGSGGHRKPPAPHRPGEGIPTSHEKKAHRLP